MKTNDPEDGMGKKKARQWKRSQVVAFWSKYDKQIETDGVKIKISYIEV